jgi:hypothetical protein
LNQGGSMYEGRFKHRFEPEVQMPFPRIILELAPRSFAHLSTHLFSRFLWVSLSPTSASHPRTPYSSHKRVLGEDVCSLNQQRTGILTTRSQYRTIVKRAQTLFYGENYPSTGIPQRYLVFHAQSRVYLVVWYGDQGERGWCGETPTIKTGVLLHLSPSEQRKCHRTTPAPFLATVVISPLPSVYSQDSANQPAQM